MGIFVLHGQTHSNQRQLWQKWRSLGVEALTGETLAPKL